MLNIACLQPPWVLLGSAAVVLTLGACTSPPAAPPPSEPFELNIAHINDHHSQLDEQSGAELTLDGQPTRVSLGGFARVTAAFKQIEANTPHLLKLHAGDAQTGSLYHTLFKGQADAAMMNTVCFDGFALGNHEFDEGDKALQGFLDALAQGDCRTPVLAANVLPQAGTPLAAPSAVQHIKPYVIRSVGGVRVGIIGIDIGGKTVNSSRPLPTTKFLDEVSTAQTQIDALQAQGVRHIVLLTHQGYENDRAMAAQLRGVDAIVGGDSHSLLGDFGSLGLGSSGPYPTVARTQDGDTVCIAQAWEYSKAIGLVRVNFDAEGRVSACQGQASLLIGTPFERPTADGKWAAMGDAEQSALVQTLHQNPALRVLEPDPEASAVLATFAQQVAAQKAQIIGQAGAPLCLVRVPGEATNRSASVPGCEQANTQARGSDAAQVVAQAFLEASSGASIALQNAGGVRVPMAAGPISMNTAFTVLPFSNVLVEMQLTGAEIRAALEDAVSNHLDQKQSDGSQPYAAGLRWDLDMSQPKGQRFSNLQTRARGATEYSALDPAKTYTVVTNDFIASGKDGYATLGQAYKAGRYVNTYVLYTQSLVNHIQKAGMVVLPARGDCAHQKVKTVGGRVLP